MRYHPGSAEALLARFPAVLSSLLHGLPPIWLDASEGPGAWSPREVAAHLADLEQDAWVARAQTILEHGPARVLPGVDRERFRSRWEGAPIGTVLSAFEEARAANLRTLNGMALDDRALQTVGRHGVQGEVRLSQLLSAWVVHDLTHLAQIARTLAGQYREEVGSWIEYLSILHERGKMDAKAGAGVSG